MDNKNGKVCKKCGSDKLSVSVYRWFSEDDGQLESYTITCSNCNNKQHISKWGYSITDKLLEMLNY
jgi:hypothetical protein